jgi:hypothetical protein
LEKDDIEIRYEKLDDLEDNQSIEKSDEEFLVEPDEKKQENKEE